MLEPPTGGLKPANCGSLRTPEETTRLLFVAREQDSSRSLAAAVALSTTTEDLLAARRRLEIRAKDWTSSERNLAAGALDHALALASGDAAYLLTAFEHTEAALTEDPSSLAGLFNRAIIAADLGLCRVAARTWRQYLAREPDSAWAQEAAERLSLLPCKAGRPVADSSADSVISYAIGTLLPSWLKAREQGARAAALSAAMARRGEELHTRTGDPMIRRLVNEINAPSDAEHLNAIVACVRGRVLLDDERHEEARGELLRARQPLWDRRSCLAPWTDLWLARLDLSDGRSRAAEDRLAILAKDPELARSRYLKGRVLWAWGLAAARTGRLQTAYDRIARAEDELRRGGSSITAASMQSLRAETLAHLGFEREAWTPRILAVRALQALPSRHRYLHSGLIAGNAAAQGRGARSVAEAFLVEANEVPQANHNVISETGAPKTFLATLDFFGAKGDLYLRLQALREKATSERRARDFAAARHTLDGAIELIKQLQTGIHSDEFGIRHLDSVQDIFDDAIDAAVAANEPLRALELLEAARRSAAANTREQAPLARLSLTNADSGGLTGEGPVIVVFGMTPQTFVWWRVDGTRVRWGWDEAPRIEVLAKAVVDSAASGRTRPDALAHLYQALLADALEGVPPGRPLVVVPDGILQRVPFAALRNPETGAPLIERRAISFQTSLAAASERAGSSTSPRRKDWTVIAVGDPAFDRRRLPLARLPAAAREAEQVAAVYGRGARLLIGETATAEEVRHAVVSAEVLHVASHATAGRGPFDSAVLLAADAGTESTGLASAEEILPPASDLQLVVLSGCSTLGLKPSRSGGLLGLARTFATRGVPATLGTLWDVDDQLLPELMTDFHRFLLDGHSPAEALRRAQLAYLAGPSAPCCDWAGVQLIGDLPAEPPVQR
ncbi:MAG TPA: CHAT domain-containing protein [Thermoanaerobaculia bacterium]|nr:CHAT domain-containing protein [Thermoanaerobaculia bacterium]